MEQSKGGSAVRLTYIPRAGIACPSDGWPAANHDEPDAQLAARKVASGFYRRENDKERRAADRELADSKKRANQKFDEAAKTEIRAAEGAVKDAQTNAVLTRQRLGKEE